MCYGGHSTPLSVRYFNAQLSSLWENARDCYQHGGSTSTAYQNTRFTRALAQFHYFDQYTPLDTIVSSSDLPFYAEFGKPRLEFVCDHEILLFLIITDGHILPESSTRPQKVNST